MGGRSPSPIRSTQRDDMGRIPRRLDRCGLVLYRGLQLHTVRSPHRPRFRGAEPPPLEYFRPFPAHHVEKLQRAIDIMIEKSTGNASCDLVFRNSGHGKTLGELLAGNDIWVSYHPMVDGDPAVDGGMSPAAFAHEKDIVIFEQGMLYPALILASVLTHELDHVNGVGAQYMPLDRFGHGMADHAAFNCTGVISPRTIILNDLKAYGVKCGSCRMPD